MFISAKDKLSKAGEPAEKVPDVKSVQSLKSKDPKVSGAKWRGGLETIQGKGRPEIAAHLPTAHLIERSKKEEKVAKRESLIQEMKSESFLPSTFKNWIHRIKRAKKLAPDPILRTSKKDIRGRPPKTPSWKDFLSGISNLTVMKEYRRGQYPDLKRLIEGDKPPTNLTRAQFKDLKEWYKPWYVQNKKEAKKSMFISAKDKLSKAKKGSLSHNEDQGAEYKLRTRTLRYLGLTRNQLTDAERQMTTRDLWNLHKDKKRSFFLYRKKALKGAKYSPHGRSATWTPEKGYVQPSKVIKKKKSKHERLVLMPLAEIATSGDMTSKQRKEWAEDVKNREGGKLLESFSGLKTAAGANKLLRETRKYTKKPTIADRLHTLYEQPPAQTKSKKVETKEKSMFISAKDKLSKAVKNPKAESAQKMFESLRDRLVQKHIKYQSRKYLLE